MSNSERQFVDVYAGAGGLSLGLMFAGWNGLFAIEKSPMAFETLKYNLIDKGDAFCFEWPSWLPREATSIENFLASRSVEAAKLKGLPLLSGGPPCQGFSAAGRRRVNDERNRLFERYLELVALVQPKMLLIENVPGFAVPFVRTEKGANGVLTAPGEDTFNAAEELQSKLEELGYKVFTTMSKPVMAREYGVPQLRPRYILVAILSEFLGDARYLNPLAVLPRLRERFLRSLGLPTNRDISAREAISDLERAHGHLPCQEPGMAKFAQGKYGPIQSTYQGLMRSNREGCAIPTGEPADSHRFSNHEPTTIQRFQLILDQCRPGISLNDAERAQVNTSKHTISCMAGHQVSHTLTSLPDDRVHYSEPRILTVREYARIQSFPDWFEFKSKYTTGDLARRTEVPRYTQVANAVPPLLGWAVGWALAEVYNKLCGHDTPWLDTILCELQREAAVFVQSRSVLVTAV